MTDSRIVNRYVAALYGAAEKGGEVDLVESDLGLIAYTLESAPDLARALAQPLVPAEKKKEIIAQIFADKIRELTLHYLFLTTDMNRTEVIKQTEAEYVRIANERRGIAAAEVRSARKLESDQLGSLKERLEARTGKKIRMAASVDESLIGGVWVRIGDTVMDGSVAGLLANLRERMLGEPGQARTE